MKDSTVSARVENNVKIEAEEILQKLGVPVSVVINSLYRQIIYHHGVPFSLTIPSEPRTIDVMTNVELDKKLQHSYAQSLAGEGRSMNEVFDDLEGVLNKWTPMKLLLRQMQNLTLLKSGITLHIRC